MNNKRSIAALVVAFSAISFGLGAMSNTVIISVSQELLRRAGNDRMYIHWFSPGSGIDSPEARAFFRGRAEAFEQANELLLRAAETGAIDVAVAP